MNFSSICFLFLMAFMLCAGTASEKNIAEQVVSFQAEARQRPFPPCKEEDIPRYKAMRIKDAPVIDGVLDEEVWKNITRSSPFVDLIHGTPTHLDTRASVTWDDQHLYIAYWLEEPNVKATLKNRDDAIYTNNDVEFFIAGIDGYYEFEINAYGTIYDVLFFWEDAFQRKGYATMPQFDRTKPGVRPFNGVGLSNHPRGKRIGFWNWDISGIKTAVHVDGTINKDDDIDKGWTVEIAVPWPTLEILARGDNRSLPPRNGDVWRIDFSRFNTYKDKSPGTNDSGGWAWSAHGVWDSHVPECFTFIEFESK
jgi:hypothetical protein